MICNYCDVGEIEYDRDTKKAYNLDGSDHIHPKKPTGEKKNFTKKEAIPIEFQLEISAKVAVLEDAQKETDKLVKELMKAVAQISNQRASDLK